MVLEGHTGPVSAVAISTDGAAIVSAGSLEKVLRVWNTETGQVPALILLACLICGWF